MKNDILILADFCGPLDGTFNSRFLYLADMIAKDNDVEVVTGDFDHGRKGYINGEIEKHNYKITMLHESYYPTNICLRRFRSHYVWGKNVKEYLKSRKKPDVVYCAVPTLLASLNAARYCEENGIRFVIDIQDLWPEAFQMVVRIPVFSDFLFAPFRWMANEIYKQADAICAVSGTYVDRALQVNKKCTTGTTVYLGTELETFDSYISKPHSLSDYKKKNEIWIAYCGTLGSSYDITVVIDAIASLRDNRIKLIVMGDGPRMEEFRKRAEEKKLPSVFTGRLPYEEMCSVLSACDIAVNPITHNAAQSIINKHADYVAAGLPIVSTQENVEFQKLIDDYQMGYNCENGNIADVARSIKYLVDNNKLRKQMGKNARQCAEERFDRKTTYKRLAAAIMG